MTQVTMKQDFVLGFAFSADKSKVVLILKNRPVFQAGKLNGIGGKIEKDELPLTAMCREFQEETGVETQADDWSYFADLQALDGVVHCYHMCDDKILSAQTMEDQDVIICPVQMDELQKTAYSSCAWLIGIALDENKALSFVTANYNQYFNTGYKKAE